MVEVKAQLKHARISSRKVRLVADMIRGLSVSEAVRRLELTAKRSSPMVLKLLRSAVANATNNANLSADNLIIKKIIVNQGVALKRFRPAAMGSAHGIKKHACHIEIILTVKPGTEVVKKGKKEAAVKEEAAKPAVKTKTKAIKKPKATKK